MRVLLPYASCSRPTTSLRVHARLGWRNPGQAHLFPTGCSWPPRSNALGRQRPWDILVVDRQHGRALCCLTAVLRWPAPEASDSLALASPGCIAPPSFLPASFQHRRPAVDEAGSQLKSVQVRPLPAQWHATSRRCHGWMPRTQLPRCPARPPAQPALIPHLTPPGPGPAPGPPRCPPRPRSRC